MQGSLPLTFTRNHLYAKKARGVAVWRLGDTKQRGTRSAVRKQVQRWTRGQGLNRRGEGGVQVNLFLNPSITLGMLWYCRSTLIGRSVVVLWWRCLPPPVERGGGWCQRGGGGGSQVHSGVAPGCIAIPPLLTVIGPTLSAGRFKPV